VARRSKHVNTPEWRARANAAFDARGHGARRQCARDCGFDASLLTRILDGRTATSAEIGAISKWLKIPPPPVAEHEETAELMELANRMTPEKRRVLVAIAHTLLEQA